ncbi:glutathione transferase [Sarocladium strictum]
MTIKIYGHEGTVCTKRVLITLHELNLPYELIKIELIKIDLAKREHRTPEFYAKHPIGRVPYLEDDEGGSVIGLAESRPICRYLVVRYGGESTLMPKPTDIESFARFEEAASYEQCYFDHHATQAGVERHFARMERRAPNEVLVKKHIAHLADIMKAYDSILAKRRFIAGENFTIVDVFHGPGGWLAQQMLEVWELFEKHPNVRRWWADISARESFKKYNEVEYS